MKRKPTFAPYIGSISCAAVETDEIITHLADNLALLLRKCRVDRETRKAHMALVNETANCLENYPAGHATFLPMLVDALTHYAPPYTTFGEQDGEWGFWPQLDDDMAKVSAHEERDQRAFWGHGDIFVVNDHGNVTCGRFDKRGRFHSYWSAV